MTNNKRAMIADLLKKGKTVSEIAELTGASKGYVYDTKYRISKGGYGKIGSYRAVAKPMNKIHDEDLDEDIDIEEGETLKKKKLSRTEYESVSKDGLSPIDLLKIHDLNPNHWVLVNAWHKEKNPGVFFSSLLVRQKKQGEITYNDIVKFCKEGATPIKVVSPNLPKNGYLQVICIADTHFGLENWDERVLAQTIANVRHRLEKTESKKIILALLGDLFHSSSDERGLTFKGTELGNINWVGGMKMGKSFLISLLTVCKEYCKDVEIYAVSGNHDRSVQSAFLHGFAEGHFPDIEITQGDVLTTSYKNTDMLFTHGDKIKRAANFHAMFNNEQIDVLHNRNYIVFTAHEHHEETNDKDGILNIKVGSKQPGSAWEHGKTYRSRKTWSMVEFDDNGNTATYVI